MEQRNPHELCRESALERALSYGYNTAIERTRPQEYPQLTECTYLDHAGATPSPVSGIRAFSADLCSNLYGNPHSASPSSLLSTQRVNDVRLRVLRYLNADPEAFDVVFCGNATAAVKLVAEGFVAAGEGEEGWRYRFHGDAHTSLVGVRELATDASCLETDADVERWLEEPSEPSEGGRGEDGPGLFAWPGQSNLTGRRLPLQWAGRIRARRRNYYTLLDAAALLTTSPLDLSGAGAAPDFTVFSFYKIFGFPDLGGLVVRRASAGVLAGRRYFGGGTVGGLTIHGFVARKTEAPHQFLEDGTVPFHSIIALDAMMTARERVHGSPVEVCAHAFSLARLARELMGELEHGNGRRVCTIYGAGDFASAREQGPTIAFNMRKPDGAWVGYADVEKLAAVKKIHLRVGTMCNPGGMSSYVGLKSWEMEQNYKAGHVCSDDRDVIGGKPTGAVRVSFAAMSTLDDVLVLVRFLEEFYVDRGCVPTPIPVPDGIGDGQDEVVVDSLIIYPIKSCGGYKISPNVAWEIKPHGLAWDREWCLVHLGTGAALSQKAYNKMALLRPEIDLSTGVLTVTSPTTSLPPLQIPLHASPTSLHASASRVCGDKITALTYNTPSITNFFTAAVGVPCTLARLPPDSASRNYKPHLSVPPQPGGSKQPAIQLSNESPILLLNLASVASLNLAISSTGGKPASADVFRANIVVRCASAYAEDAWARVRIGEECFDILGPCRRCHMVCIDQTTAQKDEEPFVTLARTRRVEGRVLFGMHATHLPRLAGDEDSNGNGNGNGTPTIRVGDKVVVLPREEEAEVESSVDARRQTVEVQVEVEVEARKQQGGLLHSLAAMVPRSLRAGA
ncbi:pyridoxal phosphate-dependent transferase [Tricharina praecox]|uniref:pyridoxal phosphate-dependent transferase n=1 Tax=Tricharina praecox TaxID=43433 RepID=UPI00221EC3A5|nr:pyridoxal phosphate-dependent transferase [Tricharina praecox]KAI5849974.1 pyridoxal phosphate-dependent transferase [Tricharina praecox]